MALLRRCRVESYAPAAGAGDADGARRVLAVVAVAVALAALCCAHASGGEPEAPVGVEPAAAESGADGDEVVAGATAGGSESPAAAAQESPAPEEGAHSSAGRPVTAASDPAPAAPPPETTPPEPPAAPLVPGDGELEIGRPTLARGGGRINAGMLLREVERKHGGMLSCYNVALGRDPTAAGDLVLVMVIDMQGMVGVQIEEDDPDLAAAGVTSCVVEKLRGVEFEEHPPTSELRISLPLHFEP